MTINLVPAAYNTEALSSHLFIVTIGMQVLGAFTEVTLPALEFETEEVKEGGQNYYMHTLIGRRKNGRITLKRGLVRGSIMLDWFMKVHDGEMDEAYYEVSVIMFNPMRIPQEWWFFGRAFPVKYTGPTLKAESAAVAIETLELAVHDYERMYIPPGL